jgi:hypothetical protein
MSDFARGSDDARSSRTILKDMTKRRRRCFGTDETVRPIHFHDYFRIQRMLSQDEMLHKASDDDSNLGFDRGVLEISVDGGNRCRQT